MPTDHPAYEAPDWESDQEDDEENPYGAPFREPEPPEEDEEIPDGTPLWEPEPENYEENLIEAPFQELWPDEKYHWKFYSEFEVLSIDKISQPPISAHCPEDDSDAILDIPPPQRRGQLDPETLQYTQSATEDLRLEFRRLNMIINLLKNRTDGSSGPHGSPPDSSISWRSVLDRAIFLDYAPEYENILLPYSDYAWGYERSRYQMGLSAERFDENDLFDTIQADGDLSWLEARWLTEFFRTYNIPLTTEGDIDPESFNSVHLRHFMPDIYHPGLELMSCRQVRSLVLTYLKRAAKRDLHRTLFIEKQKYINPNLTIDFP
jgi:hypothetical protein